MELGAKINEDAWQAAIKCGSPRTALSLLAKQGAPPKGSIEQCIYHSMRGTALRAVLPWLEANGFNLENYLVQSGGRCNVKDLAGVGQEGAHKYLAVLDYVLGKNPHALEAAIKQAGTTPLHATDCSSYEVLLQHREVRKFINHEDSLGRTPLTCQFHGKGRLEAAQALLEHGASAPACLPGDDLATYLDRHACQWGLTLYRAGAAQAGPFLNMLWSQAQAAMLEQEVRSGRAAKLRM